MTNYEPLSAPDLSAAAVPPPVVDANSAFLRCPMPPIMRSGDAAKQFSKPGLPQTRILSVLPNL